jgi:hypothetical protein
MVREFLSWCFRRKIEPKRRFHYPLGAAPFLNHPEQSPGPSRVLAERLMIFHSDLFGDDGGSRSVVFHSIIEIVSFDRGCRHSRVGREGR